MEQPMENAVSSAANGKSGKGAKIVATIASVVALAGIGFGVYGMIQANSTKDLKIEVKNADGTTSTIEADKIEVKDGNTAVISEPTEKEDSSRYVYLGEWGLKIKLDDNMEFATYLYSYNTDQAFSYVHVSGAPKNGQVVPKYADFDVCSLGLGAVSRVPVERYEAEKDNDYAREPFMTRDGYAYFYSHPQALCSDDRDGELKMAEYIEKMLSNPDNYSAI
jgi:hypothetical protein